MPSRQLDLDLRQSPPMGQRNYLAEAALRQLAVGKTKLQAMLLIPSRGPAPLPCLGPKAF